MLSEHMIHVVCGIATSKTYHCADRFLSLDWDVNPLVKDHRDPDTKKMRASCWLRLLGGRACQNLDILAGFS